MLTANRSTRPFTKQADRDDECPIAEVLAILTDSSIPTGYGWVRMHCPFHSDRVMSASVNHQLNAFVCYGCGVKGNSYSLLRSQQRLTHSETLERLGRGGTPISRSKPPRKSELFARELLWS